MIGVVVVAMLLAGLAAGLVVLRDILFEAVERVRSGGPDRSAENDGSTGPPRGPVTGAQVDADGRAVCGACGRANDPRFDYCKHCATELR